MKKYRKKRSEEKRLEDLLKFLYHSLYRHTGFPHKIFGEKAKDLLDSVGRAERLQGEGYLEKKGDEWMLTEKGKEAALDVIRRHRIIEKYLAEKTGVEPFRWHDLAERLEHELSEKEVGELERLLGYPLFDPHGDPIPSDSGLWVEQTSFPLSEAHEGDVVRILHLEDEPRELAKEWHKRGFYSGALLKVVEKTSDKLVISFEGETLIVPTGIAVEISVKTVDPSEWSSSVIRLSRLQKGEEGIIVQLSGRLRGLLRQRLMDLGFVKGARVRVYMEAPLHEPVAYDVKGSTIALRKEEADNILIEKR